LLLLLLQVPVGLSSALGYLHFNQVAHIVSMPQ
jgi:hypothetical protein